VLARTTGAVAALIGVLVTAWGTVLVATSAEDEDRVRGVVGVVGLVAGIALLAVGVGGWRAARRERR
jgi:dipeptide/tripeptide permease